MGQDGEAPSDYQSFAVVTASSLIMIVNLQVPDSATSTTKSSATVPLRTVFVVYRL